MTKFSLLAPALILCAAPLWAEKHSDEMAEKEPVEIGEIEVVLVEENVDFEAAEKIFRRSCKACHGNKAQGVASYPNLSDLEAEEVAGKLIRYREGEKIGPNSVLMIQHAKKLSDEDIANLSVYVTTAFDEDS